MPAHTGATSTASHGAGTSGTQSHDRASNTTPNAGGSNGSQPAVIQNPPARQASQNGNARPVYLIVYNSPLFAAHWSLFIPQLGSDTLGKLIHVTGDVREGFQHQFKRNYDLSETTHGYQRIALPSVAANHIVDVRGNGQRSSDTTPHDDLERIALEVPAPGPSLRSATAGVSAFDSSSNVTLADTHFHRRRDRQSHRSTARIGWPTMWIPLCIET